MKSVFDTIKDNILFEIKMCKSMKELENTLESILRDYDLQEEKKHE